MHIFLIKVPVHDALLVCSGTNTVLAKYLFLIIKTNQTFI